MLSQLYLTLGDQKPSFLPGLVTLGGEQRLPCGWPGEPPEGVGGVIFRLWG